MSTSLVPSSRQRWQRLRAPLAAAAVVLAAATVVAVSSGPRQSGLLDPRAVDPEGSRAAASLLRQHGVAVELVETTDAAVAAAGRGSTVLVALPDRLAGVQLRRLLATGAELLLVAPDDRHLAVVAPALEVAPLVRGEERRADCELPAAVRAGPLELAGAHYARRGPGGPPAEEAAFCYAVDEQGRPAAPLVRLRSERPNAAPITLLGDAEPLTNDGIDESGNAALALGLLGANPRLVWYVPSPDDVPVGGAASPLDLVPPGVTYALEMLVVAVVLLALWRGRRLGPVVSEPLPVVVRATETVEGRATLYRRGRARDRAGEALREATRTRLRTALGLPRGSAPAALADAAAGRTGRDRGCVGELLYGAAPADEGALVGLASELDRLESEVRHR